MTCRFFIHNFKGGTFRDFSFTRGSSDLRTAVDRASRNIAEMLGVSPEDVEFVDYCYGCCGEAVKG